MNLVITWEFRVKVHGETRDPEDWPKFHSLETAERFAMVSIQLGKAAIIYATPHSWNLCEKVGKHDQREGDYERGYGDGRGEA